MNPTNRYQRSASHGRQSNANNHIQLNVSDSMLPRMIAYINNLPTGCIHLKDLHKQFCALSTNNLWSFVRDNPSNFQIQREQGNQDLNKPSGNEVIWVKTDLRLCEKHCRRGKQCLGECGELHLCRNYLLLGDKSCPFQKSGKTCSFGHSFNTNHNSKLLSMHKLSRLSVNELRLLFRRRICRSVSTMPQICIYYNGKGGKGCSNKQCRSLHLCLDFVLERCHGGVCKKNHSMSVEQVAFTLDLFAIDQSWPNDLVLEDLRSIMKKRIRNDSDVSSVVSGGSNGYEDADDDEDDDNEMFGYAVGGAEKSGARKKTQGCCSHCNEMRYELIKVKEKMQELEEQLVHLKTSNSQIQRVRDQSEEEEEVDEDEEEVVEEDDDDAEVEEVVEEDDDEEVEEELEEEDQFSDEEKQNLAVKLFPMVKSLQPKMADQITKMILNMKKSQLNKVLTSQDDLKSKIEEAAVLLNSFLGK